MLIATSTSSEIRKDLVEDLEICSYGQERKELLELLSNPHVKVGIVRCVSIG